MLPFPLLNVPLFYPSLLYLSLNATLDDSALTAGGASTLDVPHRNLSSDDCNVQVPQLEETDLKTTRKPLTNDGFHVTLVCKYVVM